MSTHAADEASYTINISVRASLWTRGEDIRLVLFPDGEAETLTCIFSETQTKAPGAAKHRRNYDDLECRALALSRSSTIRAGYSPALHDAAYRDIRFVHGQYSPGSDMWPDSYGLPSTVISTRMP